VLVVRPEGRRSLGIPRFRWKDNIKMYLPQVIWESMSWIYLTRNMDLWRSLVNAVMNFRDQ